MGRLIHAALAVSAVIAGLLAPSTVALAIEPPADAVTWPVHPGVTAFSVRRADPPLAVDGVIWRRDRRELDVVATASFDRARGREIIRSQVERLATVDTQPLAAVNGDFSMIVGPYAGSTSGPFVRRGELMRFVHDRPAFIVTVDGDLAISPIATRAAVTMPDGVVLEPSAVNRPTENGGLIVYTPAWGEETDSAPGTVEVVCRWPLDRLTPNARATARVIAGPDASGDAAIPADGFVLAAIPGRAGPLLGLARGDALEIAIASGPVGGIEHAVGGWPVLVSGGEIVFEARADEPAHPRTAVGFDAERAVMLTIDGRQPGYSMGVTLPELAAFMRSIGCVEALNLDGGGSSTMWLRGEVINRPSDGRERALPNGVALVSRSRVGAPSGITLRPGGPIVATPGATITLEAGVTDDRLHPVPGDHEVSWRAEGSAAVVSGGVVHAVSAGVARVIASASGARGEVDVLVVERPDALVAEPGRLALVPGTSAAIGVRGELADGRRVAMPAGSLSFVADASGAVAIDEGAVRALRGPAVGAVTARALGLSVRVPVAVAGPIAVRTFDGSGAASRVRCVTYGSDSLEGEVAVDTAAGLATLRYAFDGGAQVQAVYAQIDHPLEPTLALRARVRGDGAPVHLKATIVDGNGSSMLYTMHRGVLGEDWTTVEAALPVGVKRPMVWKNVYAVHVPGAGTALRGSIEIDALEVMALPPWPDARTDG